MLSVFDTVLTSNDLSIDRVLHTGLPVALLFYDKNLPDDIRHSLDNLARQYAGKVLVVRLFRQDALETARKYDIRQFPTLVSIREGKPVARQESPSQADLRAHVAFLAGQGPVPASHTETASSGPTRQATAPKGPVHVSEADFEREVLRSDKPVLVDFWAEWCGPCRMMEPTLEKLSRQQTGGLKVAKVNVDENPGLSSRYGVSGIPTMIVVQNGREVDRLVGALPESALRNRLARWIRA